MTFDSPTFLFLFLPLVLTAAFLTPKKFKFAVLLAASIGFYIWTEPRFFYLYHSVDPGQPLPGIAVG